MNACLAPHPLAKRLDECVRENSNKPDLSLQILTGEFRVLRGMCADCFEKS